MDLRKRRLELLEASVAKAREDEQRRLNYLRQGTFTEALQNPRNDEAWFLWTQLSKSLLGWLFVDRVELARSVVPPSPVAANETTEARTLDELAARRSRRAGPSSAAGTFGEQVA